MEENIITELPKIEQFIKSTEQLLSSITKTVDSETGLFDSCVTCYIDPEARFSKNLPVFYAAVRHGFYKSHISANDQKFDNTYGGGLLCEISELGFDVLRVDNFSPPTLEYQQKYLYENKATVSYFNLPITNIYPGFFVHNINGIGPSAVQIIKTGSELADKQIQHEETSQKNYTEDHIENIQSILKDLKSDTLKTVCGDSFDVRALLDPLPDSHSNSNVLLPN